MIVGQQDAGGAPEELPIIARDIAIKTHSPPIPVVRTSVNAEVNCKGRASRIKVVSTMRWDRNATGLTPLIDQLHTAQRETRGERCC